MTHRLVKTVLYSFLECSLTCVNLLQLFQPQQHYNFCAGPAALPTAVLEKAQQELLDWQGKGLSIMEMSHR
jgi:hypothetical protein